MPDRTPEEIERDIERERAALAASLSSLQRQFDPEHLVELAGDYVRRHGGTFAELAVDKVRKNPVAAGLAGASLAWLLSGTAAPRIPSRSEGQAPAPQASPPAYDTTKTTPVGGFRTPEPRMAEFDDRIAGVDVHNDPAIAPEQGDPSMTYANTPYDTSEMTLTEKLMQGTEEMTEAARRRVIRAREAAHEASRVAADRAADYAAAGRDAFDSKPLVAGLIAFGIGAAIGASLPRTRREDALLGQHRDRALAEAERIFNEEKARLRAAATEALTEARKSMPSADDVAKQVEEIAKSSGQKGPRKVS